MKKDALEIVSAGIKAADPYESTVKILKGLEIRENIYVLSCGKAAVPMARAAQDVFSDRLCRGLLVTKYHHTGEFSSPYFEIIEAGHPVSDENSELAAQKGLELVKPLTEKDVLIVLLSGGGSALFEKSRVSSDIQRDITKKLLSSGADIRQINAVRKRLSLVKGGRLAAAAYPARVITLALSDVLSNDKGVIASGITVKDEETDDFVCDVLSQYLPHISENVRKILLTKDDITINDGGYYFSGDINILCDAAGKAAEEKGYTVHHKSRSLTGEARNEALRLIDEVHSCKGKHCYIYGGETVVTLRGNGRGGRNQEMALSAAIALRGKKGIAFISAGSDGTDGPTDAAGGYCDGETFDKMVSLGIDPKMELESNNSNYALEKVSSLVVTGPTGTNVNDITIVLTDDYEN